MVHHYNWGLPVAVDLFAAALGAGAFMVAVIADMVGGRRHKTISFLGALIAPWPVIIGVLLLVLDLGNPARFWEMLLKASPEGGLEAPGLMFSLTSTMSVGTWTLTFFVIVSLLYSLFHILSYPFRSWVYIRKLTGVAGLPLAVMVTIYTGVLLSATPNPAWNNMVLPIVFVASAVATGIAAVVMLASILRMIGKIDEYSAPIPLLEKMMGTVMIVQLVAMVAFLIAAPKSAVVGMFSGSASALLPIILLGLGLVVPLLMTLKGKIWVPLTAIAGIVLAVEGNIFLMRVIETGRGLVPIVFFLSAMVTGIVAELVIVSILKMTNAIKSEKSQTQATGRVVTRMVILQVACVAIVMIAATTFPEIGQAQLGALLTIFVIGLGLAVPTILTLKGKTLQPATSLLTALLVLEGGFFLRYVLLTVGQM